MRVALLTCLAGAIAIGSASAGDGAAAPKKDVDPQALACQKLTPAELAPYVGAPVRITQTNAAPNGAGNCVWQGSKADVVIKVDFFPGESHGVPPGMERAYFDQMIGGLKDENAPGEVVEISGAGESAWALNLKDNAPRFYPAYVFKNQNNATIVTNGLDAKATEALARLVLAKM